MRSLLSSALFSTCLFGVALAMPFFASAESVVWSAAQPDLTADNLKVRGQFVGYDEFMNMTLGLSQPYTPNLHLFSPMVSVTYNVAATSWTLPERKLQLIPSGATVPKGIARHALSSFLMFLRISIGSGRVAPWIRPMATGWRAGRAEPHRTLRGRRLQSRTRTKSATRFATRKRARENQQQENVHAKKNAKNVNAMNVNAQNVHTQVGATKSVSRRRGPHSQTWRELGCRTDACRRVMRGFISTERTGRSRSHLLVDNGFAALD